MLNMKFRPRKVLEIGSNDGPFISNFSKVDSICVEPCGNFAEITNGMGYHTYDNFWTTDLSEEIYLIGNNQKMLRRAGSILAGDQHKLLV